MEQTIIINGVENVIRNWTASSLTPPAGWAPGAEAAHDAEMARMGISVLKPGQASFTCDATLQIGTVFVLKENGQKFTIIAMSADKYVAGFSP